MKPSEIIDHVCKSLELDKNLLIGKPRKPCKECGCKVRAAFDKSHKYVDGRLIVCYLIRLKHNKDYSYRAIAEMLGRTLANGRGDHSFVLWAESACRDLLESKDKLFVAKYLKCEISKKINSLDQ